MVAFSPTDSRATKPSWCRSCGTKPTPAASADGTSPGFGCLPLIVMTPLSARRSPTMLSARPTLPLLPDPARPTISPPAFDGQVDVLVAARGVEAAHLQDDLGAGVDLPGPGLVGHGVLAGHRGHQRVVREFADGAGDDVAGVAEDGDALADLVHLFEVVRDEHHGDALLAQVAHAVEEALDGRAVELGGRLVEDDEPRAEGERAGDLDQLPLLDAQVAGEPERVDVDVVLVEEGHARGRAWRAS